MMYLYEKKDLVADVRDYIGDWLFTVVIETLVTGMLTFFSVCLLICGVDESNYVVAFIGGFAITVSVLAECFGLYFATRSAINIIACKFTQYYQTKVWLEIQRQES